MTGCNGFIGSHLVKVLLAEGYRVRGLVRSSSDLTNLEGLQDEVQLVRGDLRSPRSLEEAVRDVEAVFHVAALYRFWARDEGVFHKVNVEGTKNLLQAAREAGVRRVVFTGTASLLARSEDGRSLPPSDESLEVPYKRTKYLAEQEVLRFAAEEGPEAVVASPTVPVGSGDLGPTPTGRMILEFLRGNMAGFFDMKFNVIAVEDVAWGHLAALEKGESGERYVLGNRNTSLEEVLRLLSRITGQPPPRFRIPLSLALGAARISEFWEGTLLRRRPTIPLAAVRSAALDERVDPVRSVERLSLPQTPLVRGLKEAVDWFYEMGYVSE